MSNLFELVLKQYEVAKKAYGDDNDDHDDEYNIFNYSLFLYTIKRLSATFTTLVDYVVPIVGILVGYIFLDEIVDNIFFVTLILIFISLYLAVKDESENLN